MCEPTSEASSYLHLALHDTDLIDRSVDALEIVAKMPKNTTRPPQKRNKRKRKTDADDDDGALHVPVPSQPAASTSHQKSTLPAFSPPTTRSGQTRMAWKKRETKQLVEPQDDELPDADKGHLSPRKSPRKKKKYEGKDSRETEEGDFHSPGTASGERRGVNPRFRGAIVHGRSH